MTSILLAEDDATLRKALVLALRSEGYEARACKDGAEALAAYAERRPDLLLLDVMMPRRSGYDVCAEIRRTDPQVPVIFLTAKSGDDDQVLGLGLGADDFIAKPVKLDVLFARIAAVLKRTARTEEPVPPAPAEAAPDGVFAFGGALVDAKRFTVRAPDGAVQPLTIRELGLLRTFAAHPGEVLSRDALLDAVWGVDYVAASRTLDQHIVQVRRKLGSAGAAVETVRGAGYRYRAP
ncbi:MAG: response regulator transcription factor [Kiritimatiellae bacterium]|nr:response regulator transcription factor [Kiritimatiellia bacterium]